MNIYKEIIEAIKESKNIIITSHKSADGDSVGSSLGLYYFIKKLGGNATICHPDAAPSFLYWLDTSGILLMTDHEEKITEKFKKADLIFSLDYNGTDRVGEEMQVLLEQSTCQKIMIDHHLDPQNFADITLSQTTASSTSELIVDLIEYSENEQLLDEEMGTPLYLGILTDTGRFRFPSTTPRTHEALSKLLKAGVKHHLIHEKLSDNNTESRLRLQGFALSEKLEVIEEQMVSIISLTKEELEKYNFQKGDTDTLANEALTIKGMIASILLTERDGKIKMSFRSKGAENPVNILAGDHFDGGGHANASGGKSDLSMDETLKKLKRLIPEYLSGSCRGEKL